MQTQKTKDVSEAKTPNRIPLYLEISPEAISRWLLHSTDEMFAEAIVGYWKLQNGGRETVTAADMNGFDIGAFIRFFGTMLSEIIPADSECDESAWWKTEAGEAFTLTKKEVRTVISVFGELEKMRYEKLNGFLGSLTIEEMQALNKKLGAWYQKDEPEA